MFTPRRMLVTGAAGFIGCNFVKMILSKYHDSEIVSFDKLTYAGSLENLKACLDSDRHTFVQGDILDRNLVAKCLRKYEIDTIVHFAAESHVDNSIERPEIFLQTNVLGTFELLNEAKKYWLDERRLTGHDCRFHHVSTDEVYGSLQADEQGFSEVSPYAPNSPYSASKAGSDHIVRAYYHTYDLPITMSNCSNNFGPYQHREKLIPVVIKSCLNHQKIPVYGDGSNIRDWLYVEDHCDAIDVILRRGRIGEVYNVGGNNELKNIDLVKSICAVLDQVHPGPFAYEQLIDFVQDRMGHDFRYAIDAEKMRSDLGWHVDASGFKDNLHRTIMYYVEN